jgi:hypothetical protein
MVGIKNQKTPRERQGLSLAASKKPYFELRLFALARSNPA